MSRPRGVRSRAVLKPRPKPTPEQAYWLWHDAEPLANSSVDRENVAPGPRFWERMLEAGRQAVADRREDEQIAREQGRSER